MFYLNIPYFFVAVQKSRMMKNAEEEKEATR